MFLALNAQEPALAAVFAALQPELPTTDDEVALMRAYRVLREKGIIDDRGVELRGLGPKGRASEVGEDLAQSGGGVGSRRKSSKA